MAEICLYKSDIRTMNTILVYGGRAFEFSPAYRFVSEVKGLFPDGSYQSVDVISVLQSKTNVEVGCMTHKQFIKFDVEKPAIDVLSSLDNYPARNLKLLLRDLKVGEYKVMQYFALFPADSLNIETVKQIIGV